MPIDMSIDLLRLPRCLRHIVCLVTNLAMSPDRVITSFCFFRQILWHITFVMQRALLQYAMTFGNDDVGKNAALKLYKGTTFVAELMMANSTMKVSGLMSYQLKAPFSSTFFSFFFPFSLSSCLFGIEDCI